mmetsp:Transcript_6257/g.9620  ORF Transcript_6257/g.9620 Transcript_6257/m.9620 type:complete len:126 (+) Transcript_6257:122-499(+)
MRIENENLCNHGLRHDLTRILQHDNARSTPSCEIERNIEWKATTPAKPQQVPRKRVHFARTGTRRTFPSLHPKFKQDLYYSSSDYREFRRVNADQEKGMFVMFDILLGMSNPEGEKMKALYQSNI